MAMANSGSLSCDTVLVQYMLWPGTELSKVLHPTRHKIDHFGDMAWCLSVKCLNVGSHKQHNMIAQGL